MSADIKSLIDHVAGLVAAAAERPSWDDYFMATALLLSTRSPCERLHVGCVIVSGGARKNRIVAAGYNGYLPGTPHISRMRDGHEQATVHAEQNSIADAARRGSSVEGCIAYVTHYPCINCAKILAAAGLAEIRYRNDYNNDPLVRPLLDEAGVKILQLPAAGTAAAAAAGTATIATAAAGTGTGTAATAGTGTAP
jgi:dCMP deaminase